MIHPCARAATQTSKRPLHVGKYWANSLSFQRSSSTAFPSSASPASLYTRFKGPASSCLLSSLGSTEGLILNTPDKLTALRGPDMCLSVTPEPVVKRRLECRWAEAAVQSAAPSSAPTLPGRSFSGKKNGRMLRFIVRLAPRAL